MGTGVRAQVTPSYLPAIRTEADFELMSVPPAFESEIERWTKFLLPADDDPGLLGPLFQNVARYPLHFEFLKAEFPDRFAAVDEAGYRALVERRATRRYFAGSLSRIKTSQGNIYGFTIFTNLADPRELLTVEEVRGVYQALSGVFALRPLAYANATRTAAGNQP